MNFDDRDLSHPVEMLDQPPRRREMRPATWGAICTIVGAFPVAAFVALVYRFPFPLAGYQSGVAAMLLSPIAVAVYGILLGGFVLLGLLGAVAGAVLGTDESPAETILPAALLIELAAMLLLAVWDKIYGPW